MGSGFFFPTGDPKDDGYARKLGQYDEKGSACRVLGYETTSYADDTNLSDIADAGVIDDNFGHLIYHGGPGKK